MNKLIVGWMLDNLCWFSLGFILGMLTYAHWEYIIGLFGCLFS